MAKVDLLIWPKPGHIWLAVRSHEETEEMRQKGMELGRKLLEVDSFLKSNEYLALLASKGPAEMAKAVEAELKRRGIPYIVVRGLEYSTEKDIEHVKSMAMNALEYKVSKEYVPLGIGEVHVLKIPRYEEWRDPPEEGSKPNWLWLVAGVAGAIAVPLLLKMWFKNP